MENTEKPNQPHTPTTQRAEFNLDDYRVSDSSPEPCPACNRLMMPRSKEEFCRNCQHKYPASLLKAAIDPFTYALKLRTGQVWYFEDAEIHGGDYVHLTGVTSDPNDLDAEAAHVFERGVDVRVSDIVWCADAPDGS